MTSQRCSQNPGSSLNWVGRIQFMDGTVWTYSDMMARTFLPSEGADQIYGTTGPDELSDAGGDDHIYGSHDNDILHGEEDNDTLFGGLGHDILDGGPGDDHMEGENGSDAYLLAEGFGNDTIYDWERNPGSFDTIEFGDGILPTDIRTERLEDATILTIAETGDSVTVIQWLSGDEPNDSIEAAKFGFIRQVRTWSDAVRRF
ncbi:calcium-binding protein [Thermodesulfobacteriota bacterium]